MANLPNPKDKGGIIGAFCSAYSVPEAIDAFLPGVYERVADDRYTYAEGSTTGGLELYKTKGVSDLVYAYSWHSTDPANVGHAVNAFDLVRVHKFGAGSATVKKMLDLASKNERVSAIMRDARPSASEMFEDLGDDPETGDSEPVSTKKKPSKADKLAAVVRKAEAEGKIELFHSTDKDACITIVEENETLLLASSAAQSRLNLLYKKQYSELIGASPMKDATMYLYAVCRHERPEKRLYVRTAETRDAIYIDLCDKTGQVVKIESGRVSVISGHDAPVKFIRPDGSSSLPVPDLTGKIDELRPFVNAANDTDFMLKVGFILGTFRTESAQVFLMLQGEAGTAKSTTSRVLKSLIDPSTRKVQAVPDKLDGLVLALRNAWLPAFDNLSGMNHQVSDALCQVATGGTFTSRKFFGQDDEKIITVRRPVIFNGIEDIATRTDLISRSITLEQPIISERVTEAAFWRNFASVRPRIFGAICKALAGALANRGKVTLDELPRMADFVEFVTGAEKALKWKHGTFAAAFLANQSAASDQALDSESFIEPLERVLANADGHWQGTPSELAGVLIDYINPDDYALKKRMPTGRSIGNRLKRLASVLRDKRGISFSMARPGGKKRLIILDKIELEQDDPLGDLW
jgi:hypothetical protein